jgi:thiol:disulfide interchange protein DsbC
MNQRKGVSSRIPLLLALVLAFPVMGGESQGTAPEQVRKNLLNTFPDVGEVSPSPVPGIFEVVVGGQIIYTTADGRYVFQGNLLDMEQQKNLTKPRLNAIKAKEIAAVGEENMVIFGPRDAKYTITAFTDIDCGYCRKLHSEMDQYNAEGIRVRYLFFPRAGVGSSAYDKAVTVWCSDDRKQAMTASKQGTALSPKTCDNPVRRHLALGQEMGVNGTPSLILEDGEMIPGYIPPKRLIRLLEEKEQSN